jgi:uncharacterized membrane protein YkvA (DUF1232 family)
MTEQRPMFRTPRSTVTKVLRSNAFLHSRERSAVVVDSPEDLRALADAVETLDHDSAPLAAVADRIVAAVRFLRDRADRLEQAGRAERRTRGSAEVAGEPSSGAPSAGVATRERLLVAGLHYLVTPVDLVPDFQAGGYTDDVFLLAWVFGVASHELTPYLTDAEDGDHP